MVEYCLNDEEESNGKEENQMVTIIHGGPRKIKWAQGFGLRV